MSEIAVAPSTLRSRDGTIEVRVGEDGKRPRRKERTYPFALALRIVTSYHLKEEDPHLG
jgi:hypothetical protein